MRSNSQQALHTGQVKLTDFQYELPESLVAQHPLKERSASRLLHLERGTLTVVTGRVGSGKTTLLRVLLGLLPMDAGQIRWNGAPVEAPRLSKPPVRCGKRHRSGVAPRFGRGYYYTPRGERERLQRRAAPVSFDPADVPGRIRLGRFPSGQRGQTVNLLRYASEVRILPSPPFDRHQPDPR